MGRGVSNRITCYSCTDNNKKVSYRNKHLKKKYGITQYQYKLLFEKQNGRCAICGVGLNFLNGTLIKGSNRNPIDCCIDHCHKTGKIRGLLCFHCNTALGHIFDNSEILSKMKDYIDNHSGK